MIEEDLDLEESDAEREARRATEVTLNEEDQDFVDRLVDMLMNICDDLTGLPLRVYQKPLARRMFESFIIDDSAEITALFSRQSGKSQTIAAVVATSMIMLPRLAKVYPTWLDKFERGVWVGAFAPVGLPFYLAHFKELADNVLEEGPTRGFIHIPVWRSPRENQPYNARIMESVLSLAYFYTLERPWNPYYKSPAVRQRLEAALEYYCNQQNPEGRFAEAAPQRWNLAATAFFTKFITRTLTLLKDGPPVDAAIVKRVVAADCLIQLPTTTH